MSTANLYLFLIFDTVSRERKVFKYKFLEAVARVTDNLFVFIFFVRDVSSINCSWRAKKRKRQEKKNRSVIKTQHSPYNNNNTREERKKGEKLIFYLFYEREDGFRSLKEFVPARDTYVSCL